MNLKILTLATTLALAPAALFAQPVTTPAATHPYNVHQRKENQQDRIGQGVRKGTLRPSETARLERQEVRINREERGMRSRNNGHLTRQDHRILRHQQNRESKRIFRMKHNARGR